jgi:hypothetical protein
MVLWHQPRTAAARRLIDSAIRKRCTRVRRIPRQNRPVRGIGVRQAYCFGASAGSDALAGNGVAGDGGWVGDPRMRPAGGHARVRGSRQTNTPAAAAVRITNVMIQAARRVAGLVGRGAAPASRSIAVIDGNGSDAATCAVSSFARTSAGSSKAGGSSGSRMAIHSPPQRAQRTIRRGVKRDAGTSYSAAHLGQTIRIRTCYRVARVMTRQIVGGSKAFCPRSGHGEWPIMA